VGRYAVDTAKSSLHALTWATGYADGEIGSEMLPVHPHLLRFKDRIREDTLRLGELIEDDLRKGG
jgi:hypothetical protein